MVLTPSVMVRKHSPFPGTGIEEGNTLYSFYLSFLKLDRLASHHRQQGGQIEFLVLPQHGLLFHRQGTSCSDDLYCAIAKRLKKSDG
jgi:hypothetical protein